VAAETCSNRSRGANVFNKVSVARALQKRKRALSLCYAPTKLWAGLQCYLIVALRFGA
jgi:hypothetical protein